MKQEMRDVRPIFREHLAQIAALEVLCFAEPWSEKALELLLQENAFGFVLLYEDCVVAYGGMLTVLDEGQVSNVAVHPDFRHRGYGRAVLDAMLAEARKRGLCQVSLEVRKSNRDAISLYSGAGFFTAGERKGFYRSPTEDAWVMLKNLTDTE